MDNGPVAVELSKLIAERAFDVDLNSILEFSLLAQGCVPGRKTS